jgi:hypothetical protein
MGMPRSADEFVCSKDDPLAAEHAAVAAWIEEAIASLGEHGYYRDVDLKTLASGKRLLDAKPDQSRRYVLAAVAQVRHWDRHTDRIRAQASTDFERMNAHQLPGWSRVWGRRRQASAVVATLMRRTLPFEKQDILAIVEWCNGSATLGRYFAPLGQIVRALERHASQTPVDQDLREAMKLLAVRLRSCHDKDARRLGTAVAQLCVDSATEPAGPASVGVETRPAPELAPAGCAAIFDQLKRHFRISPPDVLPSTTVTGPDRFALRDDSPLVREHGMLTAVYEGVAGTTSYVYPQLDKLRAGRELLALDRAAMGRALLAAAERHVHALLAPSADLAEARVWKSWYATAGVALTLLQLPFQLPREGLFDLLLYLSARPSHGRSVDGELISELIVQAEREAASSPLTEGERYVLWLFRVSLIVGPPLGAPSDQVVHLSGLIGDGADFFLVPGEVWSDGVNSDLSRLDKTRRLPWVALLEHALSGTAARPSARWLKTAGKLVDAIGGEQLRQALARWLPLVVQGQSIRRLGHYQGDVRGAGDVINEENASCLRGLLWIVQILSGREDLTRPITAVALSAYRKVPGVGPRAVKVGNAAVYVLSEMASTDAVGQLAMLKVRVKFGTAQKEIEKAFAKAAEALALPRDQIEEMGVPSYGLAEGGVRREDFGSHHAEVMVTGSYTELKWFDANGKALKSVPAKVKSEHKEDLKELQQAVKDIQAMLPAQRDRIDSMVLLQKTWPISLWRERYLDHPLVGTIAKRLLWCVDGTAAIFVDGIPTDVEGSPVACGKSAEIALWHPVGRGTDEVLSWRRRLEDLGITQPFKQAHREVYLLTDAERSTATYSNRFAAHIIRQHQFSALCAARGWQNKLRLMVDAEYPPPSKELPPWGLRAEFWVEGIGDDYGRDTNESGVYLRLATDQVRFYGTEAAGNYTHAGGGGYRSGAADRGRSGVNEPLPLEELSALVFSEIMRDVDLFVGVASVGNDPAWQDGGPEGRYREYWQGYSFGELSGTATTRKQVLANLVPRLKIADLCSFSDRFLLVRGSKRTYKIHLGSGNILMEPNDQYLCIVPDARARAAQDDLFLPFEGDNTLSIIIKALLLAEDAKIKDPTITRQIDGR